MAGLKDYTSVAASNTSLFPEGMAPSSVNDSARQVQADVVNGYRDSEWANWGDTPSRASASTFKITGDVTTRYTVNRALRCNDATTLYGIITASSYSAPDTTVTVNLDSGSLTTSLTAVAIASLSPTNRSIPTALGRKGADVASASTINLSTCAGTFCDVTGTTTITAITSEAAGIMRMVRFTGALTLTHNATSLILPSAANITTAANDTAEFVSLGSGNWLCFNYVRAALSTYLVQAVRASSTTEDSTATTIPLDDTAPQNTEGKEYLTLAITPKNTNNILEFDFTSFVSANANNVHVTVALYQDSTADALYAIDGTATNTNDSVPVHLKFYMAAGTTSSTTFKIRFGPNSNTGYINQLASTGALYGGKNIAVFTIKEYTP